MIANSNFLTENECKNPPTDKFEAATRIINQAEQLIYAVQDAKEHAGIDKFDDMLKPVEELRSTALEYAAGIVLYSIAAKLQEETGDEQ